jgi:glutathione S-transferase
MSWSAVYSRPSGAGQYSGPIELKLVPPQQRRENAMLLYYAPGACSQACHIALIEAGIPHQLVKVGRDKRTDRGQDYKTINPKGYTPALELEDGTILTENLVILMYIADRSGKLLAKDGLARWRTIEATEFMTTEIHGNFKPFFLPDAAESEKVKAASVLATRFGTLAEQIGEQPFLTGEQMTIADTYLFVMLAWAAMMGIVVPEPLVAYAARMRKVPSVSRTLKEEGLA